MSDKPKIYGFCEAGCRFETVHKDVFDKSAAWIKQYPDENNAYILPPIKNYKIVSPVASNAYSCVVSLIYSANGTQTVKNFSFSEYDDYRDYFYFEILSLSVTGVALTIVYEVNGNRYSEIVIGTGTAKDVTNAELKITGATAVYLCNSDADNAAIKGDTGVIALAYSGSYTEEYEGDISDEDITLTLSEFNRSPEVGETFLLVFDVTESGKSYIATFSVTQVGTTEVRANVVLDTIKDITGATGTDGKSFRNIGTFSIAVADWSALSNASPFTVSATKTITLTETIDEDCPIMFSFDNAVASVGVVVASATGTITLTVVFYAVTTPTAAITGTVGGVA